MGRQPCCEKVGLKKGSWTAEEDRKLTSFILTNGQCCWRAVPQLAGLLRCGKSCRLRWINYLRPDLKRGLLTELEEKIVIDLHAQLGNRWSKIASYLPGRTDNEIKNHWKTHIMKKLKKKGIDPITHKPLLPPLTTNNESKQQPQDHLIPPLTCEISQVDNILNKEIEISITQNQDGLLQESLDFMEFNDGFCIDEVPLVEPHEINFSSSSFTTSSFSPYASSCFSNINNCYSPNKHEDLELAKFGWVDDDFTSNKGFWDNYITNSLDFTFNKGGHGETVPTHQDPWNIGLF